MPTITLEKLTIARDNETQCCYCGFPLYHGDVAQYNDDNGNIYCSSVCACKDSTVPQPTDYWNSLEYLDRYGTAR